jgi:uncharacterized protein
MGSDFWYRFIYVCVFILITDVLLYLGLRRLIIKKKKKGHPEKKFTLIYLLISVLTIVYAITHMIILRSSNPDYTIYRQYLIIAAILIVFYLPKAITLLFIIIEFIFIFFIQIISFISQNRKHYEFVKSARRIKIISWVGIAAGFLTLLYTIYGMVIMRTDYKVVEQSVSFYNLPPAFDGTKILLFSDTHLGSYFDPEDAQKGIALIKAQSPDFIVFTGDLINVEVAETKPYIAMFNSLKAPLGKFAVLGNHDMGDYMKFYEPDRPGQIVDNLVKAEQEMGFTVLRNTHVILHRGHDSIALLGVDSWGLPPFRKRGDLDKAMQGIDPMTFKILLSHSPSHWTVEVRGRTDIGLTLSGHTHAFQAGINQFGMLWSPIVFRYPKFMGLYQFGTQFLYVNPGFGYLGFPGRIGIRPEITVITLRRS